MKITPISFAEARQFIADNHRHSKPPQGCKFCIAVSTGQRVRGVVTIGRPVARMLDDGFTAEVTRCCTDGKRNAASMLYSAAWRAARAMGYERLITYTREHESGASLRAAGFIVVGQTRAESWHRKSRPRVETDKVQKTLWLQA